MTDAIELMNIVNRAVKAGESGTGLLESINTLCSHLRTFGQQIELTNKGALDTVFVSLRQAACRDAGQLGKAARLRLMQLIELRAMKWRPNLSHSSYYSKHIDTTSIPSSSTSPVPPVHQPMPHQTEHTLSNRDILSSILQQPLMSPMLPMVSPLLPTPVHLRSPQLLPHTDLPIPIPSPTFYLLPALANMGIFPFLGPHPMLERLPKKPAKPVLREEITIRNADSGKLMGVKGRRVALVEQISGSVISFQKVTDLKSKARTLTITASDQESIEKAKSLIEDTIRRNASPVTEDRDPIQDTTYSREQLMALRDESQFFESKAEIAIIAPELLVNP
ncbi:mxt-1 [Pristionchus pacificus]|uniref:K Homology domain containing protein n=1 Tax=Pristionchus pacificus TaxID=54126 RepID=A0A2A6BMT8_PRIPA|nr:mxt-1 [Pristionchus pacificus]|eukprot:PDM67224.1 K Homology domain containing protein [Pristionchus pacificus]